MQGLGATSALFHAAESCLDLIRSGEARASRELLDALMEAIDEGRHAVSGRGESPESTDRIRMRLLALGTENKRAEKAAVEIVLDPSPDEARLLAKARDGGMAIWLLEKSVGPGIDETRAGELPIFETMAGIGMVISSRVRRARGEAGEGLLVVCFATTLGADELGMTIFDTLMPVPQEAVDKALTMSGAGAAAVPTPRPRTKPGPRSGISPGALPRILLVDDESLPLVILQKTLADYGRIDTASSGSEALAKFATALGSQPYIAVFLDIALIDIPGTEVLGQMRRLEEEAGIAPGSGSHIAMSTAMHDYGTIAEAFRKQCDLYLVKPASEYKIHEAMRKFGLEPIFGDSDIEGARLGSQPKGEEDENDPLERFRVIDLEFGKAVTMHEFHRLVILRGREILDLDRMSLLLYDAATKVQQGTWGTTDRGELVDEKDYSSPVSASDTFIADNLRKKNLLAVQEDRELSYRDRVIGRGWNAMISLWNGNEVIGWIAADNLIRQKPLLPLQRWLFVLFGELVSNHLIQKRNSEDLVATVSRLTMEGNRREAELRGLYEEANNQNALKEKLFSIFAHDLRGPLGSVNGILEMALNESAPFSDEEIRSLLPEIRNSIGASYALLENLLDWVRSHMTEIVVLRERLSLRDLVRSICDVQEPVAKRKGIVFEVEVDEGATAEGDRRIVEAILRNLLSNAVKFTPSGGKILIRSSWDEGSATTSLSIADQGIGMSPEQASRLFSMDPGKRRPGTAGEHGSGIGLVFCADLAKKLGARISVESESGKGSIFSLALPDAVEGDLAAI